MPLSDRFILCFSPQLDFSNNTSSIKFVYNHYNKNLMKLTEHNPALQKMSHSHFGLYISFPVVPPSGQNINFEHMMSQSNRQTAMEFTE